MKRKVKNNQAKETRPRILSSNEVMMSKSEKVREVARRLADESFLERIRNYHEKYWDQKWTNWMTPDPLYNEEQGKRDQ
jgi:hypothetical protein